MFVTNRLVCEAVGLPFVVFVADEGFDVFDVGGSESGVGELYDLCEAFFVGAYAEYGFLDAECFKELGSHDAVCAIGCTFAG